MRGAAALLTRSPPVDWKVSNRRRSSLLMLRSTSSSASTAPSWSPEHAAAGVYPATDRTIEGGEGPAPPSFIKRFLPSV